MATFISLSCSSVLCVFKQHSHLLYFVFRQRRTWCGRCLLERSGGLYQYFPCPNSSAFVPNYLKIIEAIADSYSSFGVGYFGTFSDFKRLERPCTNFGSIRRESLAQFSKKSRFAELNFDDKIRH